jgi:hypothetical protein
MVKVLACGRLLVGALVRYKDYEIGICCFSAKHTELRNKRNEW